MNNGVKHRDEIFVGKPQNTLCLMTKDISIFRSIFKNTARFGKVSDYKNEGMHHIRGMDRSSFPQAIMKYQPAGSNPGHSLKIIMDCYVESGMGHVS